MIAFIENDVNGVRYRMIDLVDKRVLLIVPKYYGYELEIKKVLINKGAKVTLIYENIVGYNLYYRMLYIYFKEKYKTVIYDYYKRGLKQLHGEKIDIVFAIRASSVNCDIISLIKDYCNSDCKFIMYQWDSVANNPEALEVANEFDKVSTFDAFDSEKLNWQYRPLFYINDYVKNVEKKTVDICYLCSWHSKRAQVLRRLKKITSEKNLNFFYNMRAPLILFIKHKYINKNPEYELVNFDEVSFKSISLKESYKWYQRSSIVVDYTHPGQTGLTMRTIECLGNQCKLITNNKLIKDADFYNSHNIYVYDDENITIPEGFINTPYEPIDDSKYYYYSIEGWIESILE